MKGADGFVQAYNAQAAVEPEFQLIVGQTVTEAANDKEQLMPMLATIEEQSGQRPEDVLADSGYCSEKNLEGLESAEKPERRVDGYIATERQKHDEYKEACPKGPLPKGATRVDRMRRKLKTKVGKRFTRRARRLWNRCSDRSSRRVDFGSSCCAVSIKCAANGHWCASRTTF